MDFNIHGRCFLGRHGGVRQGGHEWQYDDGVTGWDGDADEKSKRCLFFYQACHNLHKLPDVRCRLFGIEQAVRDGVIASPVARERHEGRVDFRPNIGGNHGVPRGGCIVEGYGNCRSWRAMTERYQEGVFGQSAHATTAATVWWKLKVR